MSDSQSLENGVDFIRCNLRFLKATHPEIFEHLEDIPEKGRAEEIRHVMRLGLMVKNGQLGASIGVVNSSPVANPISEQAALETVSQTASTTATDSTAMKKTEVPEVADMIKLGASDLDIGDDIFEL